LVKDAARRNVVRQIIRPTLGVLALAGAIMYVLLPQIAGARKTVSLLNDVNPLWIILAIIAETAALMSYVRLTQLTLNAKIGYGTLARIDLSTMAVSHVVPAGSVVGLGLGYRLLVRAGVPRSQAVAGKTLQTIGSAVVLNVILFVGLILALGFYGGSNGIYLPIIIAGLLLLAVVGVAVALIMKREQRVIVIVNKLLDRMPRVKPGLGARLIESLSTTLHKLGNDRVFLRRTVGWATANWLLDAASLWCCVRAFGHVLDPVGLMVAFGLANVGAALPFTPGGLGVVEGILVPTLVAFGSTRGIAILGVLTYRLFNFWVPIPVGLACYLPMARPSDSRAANADEDDGDDDDADAGEADDDGPDDPPSRS